MLTAMQNRSVLKKECTPSRSLPTNETRFFDEGHVVKLEGSKRPQATAMCGVTEGYFEVEARLPGL